MDHPEPLTGLSATAQSKTVNPPPSKALSLPSTGPFGFSFSLPGALQKTLSFTFAARLRSTIRNAAMGGGYVTSESQPQPGSSMVTDAPETDMDQVRTPLVPPFIASLIDTKDPASQIPRAASPVPTEILDDPSVEDITATLEAHGIAIRDFGLTDERRKSTLKPVPEIFDPYRGVAEFEYRLGVKTFRRPVPGKTLRRLLVMGWVTQEEVAQRCAPMDIEALDAYDARVAVDVREGWGIYPWRALKWTAVPTLQERRKLVVKYMWHFVAVDRARKHLEALERKERLSKEQAEEDERMAMEILQRRELEKRAQATRKCVLPEDWESPTLPRLFGISGEGSRKRSLSNAASQEPGRETYDGNDKDLGDDAHGEPKRVRLTPQASSSALPPSPSDNAHLFLPQSQGESLPFNAPAKQYPAPLASYDPTIYPEAASIINSQSQQRTLPPDASTPPGSPRQESQGEPTEQTSPSRVHRSMRGKLARTQTFTLL